MQLKTVRDLEMLRDEDQETAKGQVVGAPSAMMRSLNFTLSDMEIHCRDLRRKVTVSLTESLQDIIAMSEFSAEHLGKQYRHLLRHNCGRTVFCLFLEGGRWGLDGVIGGSSQVHFSIIVRVVSG